ncbi:MAG: aminotransferase class I/II-fold pyridoxal phosphate-dependent enzyme [Blastocatellia bacterium]|nr:aminotransferase class I/II-fold pyridoxal phosphate-dependent enzyme [Blastocatellia bacterium]MCS7157471.1 aminotransferase class I/II-fold pyridoxal phosphate-dependent enzyme [Blastocatellia bacterium]MCX7752644.1 aminotransferase class I/II-fold pyridoxal phosphate-dependent enzyme [Blastocatellia bacterium]MDW8168375.1 aminotransferase class I/II-fold pyridoxal phosphate-dependent enzyme [Acidobacteriota bacterium]MDW8255571.1 aminotransferase class I/II-fold pyridoxal phosphate-depend
MERIEKKKTSRKTARFTESVIREMTRLAMAYDAINLAQGFPDFPAPEEIKRAAIEAIRADINQYAITWGARTFREAIAEKVRWYLGLEVDPEREITVTCGSTEAMIASLLAILDPGDEVIIFEPFYENYGPDAILAEARPRYVPLHPPDWRFDPDELRAAFTSRTKAIIINTPNNPTGKVFTREELELIAALCHEWDVIAVTDEIYEHILYDGAEHIAIAMLPGMRERTITINGLSKTYSVTGWRVGYAIAPPEITSAIRKVHDFLTVGAPAPLQEAGAVALRLPRSYYERLAAEYAARRDQLLRTLEAAGFGVYKPRGAYYVMTDISRFGFEDDVAFAHYLVREIGVAVVPGSSFYENPEKGRQQVRFCFCKTEATLDAAAERLLRLRERWV